MLFFYYYCFCNYYYYYNNFTAYELCDFLYEHKKIQDRCFAAVTINGEVRMITLRNQNDGQDVRTFCHFGWRVWYIKIDPNPTGHAPDSVITFSSLQDLLLNCFHSLLCLPASASFCTMFLTGFSLCHNLSLPPWIILLLSGKRLGLISLKHAFGVVWPSTAWCLNWMAGGWVVAVVITDYF